MTIVLDGLNTKHGSVQNFLREIGVDENTFATLRADLLD